MERSNAVEFNDAQIIRGTGPFNEENKAQGIYTVRCLDANGNLKWEDKAQNVVTTVGKNLALDTFLAGSAYTVTGPYLGLISSVGYTGVPVLGDTMASHGTWTEAGFSTNYPTFSSPANRPTVVWSAASSGTKQFSTPLSFTIGANGGTLKGCFLVYGSAATNVYGATVGVLYSAGLFTGGDKVVTTSDTVQVSYSTSM